MHPITTWILVGVITGSVVAGFCLLQCWCAVSDFDRDQGKTPGEGES